MLYFSLPAYHNGGTRHSCRYGRPAFTKEEAFLIQTVLCILCFPIVVPILIKDRIEKWQNRRRQEQSPSMGEWRKKLKKRNAKVEAFKKQRSKWSPRPLPRIRKRAITLSPRSEVDSSCSSLSTLDAKDRETIQQSSPALLGLPPNVRQQIWEHVLGGHTIAICCARGRLVHAFKDQADSDGERYGSGEIKFKSDRARTQLSALLKTCCQVYSEAIEILYTQNTFSLYQNDTLFDLTSTILPQRFASIRSLIIHWQFRDDETFESNALGNLVTPVAAPWDVETWRHACKLLSERMPGLQDLFVVTRGPFIMNNCIVDMLQPLRDVKVEKEKFRVRVPWPRIIALTKDDGMDRRFENHNFPFEVVRTGKVIPDCDPGPEIYEF